MSPSTFVRWMPVLWTTNRRGRNPVVSTVVGSLLTSSVLSKASRAGRVGDGPEPSGVREPYRGFARERVRLPRAPGRLRAADAMVVGRASSSPGRQLADGRAGTVDSRPRAAERRMGSGPRDLRATNVLRRVSSARPIQTLAPPPPGAA